MATKLFGSFHVTPTSAAVREAGRLFPKYGDYQELRRYCLGLAFWPNTNDLDWETIDGMKEPRACELRIDEKIGGFDNLRVIFYVFDSRIVRPGDILPRLWTLGVLQKKTRRFSPYDLRTFHARATILRQREYREYL